MGELALTDLDLGVLVSLFALEPDPAAPAMLAEHTRSRRAAVADALAHLCKSV